jgi:sugar phosphate isomerase/epimerase
MKNTTIATLLLAGLLSACQTSPKTPAETAPLYTEDTENMEFKKGYQLYTIREHLTDSAAVKSAIEETAAMGYEQVETFGFNESGFFGYTPEHFHGLLSESALASPSGHYLPMEIVTPEVGPISTASIPDMLDAAEKLGQHWIVVPWMNEAWRTQEGYQHLVVYLSQLGEAARERGMVAAWHNHDFEFEPIDTNDPEGMTAYDYLMKSLEGTNVVFEMDLHWVAFAGEDPVDWFEQYPGRFPLWHVKDFAADTTTQVPVGQGVIDWERIFAHAELSGLQHYYIEQDECSADRALDCLKESLAWTSKQSFIP